MKDILIFLKINYTFCYCCCCYCGIAIISESVKDIALYIVYICTSKNQNKRKPSAKQNTNQQIVV